MPTSASTRRTPEPIDASCRIFTRPSWPERGHVRAAAQLPRVVADLDDPDPLAVLLAEQRHRAEPARLGLRGDERVHLEVADQHLVDLLLDVVQHDGGTAPGVLKSNRSRPGAFSEPAWVADSPRKLRMVWCTRWVAVCAREIARRRVTSISAKPVSPGRTSPDTHAARCTMSARHRLLHVEDLEAGRRRR